MSETAAVIDQVLLEKVTELAEKHSFELPILATVLVYFSSADGEQASFALSASFDGKEITAH